MSQGTGMFVCLVGPSGAGKDTLLRLVRDKLAARARLQLSPAAGVTRPPPHMKTMLVLTETAYLEGVRSGRFALAWRAHGLGYAIDGDVLPALAAGARCDLQCLARCGCRRQGAFSSHRDSARDGAGRHTRRAASARGRETSAAIDETAQPAIANFPKISPPISSSIIPDLQDATTKLATILRGLASTILQKLAVHKSSQYVESFSLSGRETLFY